MEIPRQASSNPPPVYSNSFPNLLQSSSNLPTVPSNPPTVLLQSHSNPSNTKTYENLRKSMESVSPNRFLKPVWQAHQNRFQLAGNRFHPALQNRFWRNRFSPKPVFNETGFVTIGVKTGSVTDFRFGLRSPCLLISLSDGCSVDVRLMLDRCPIEFR